MASALQVRDRTQTGLRLMPNTLPTNLANALTELVKRRQDIRTQDRQAPTDEAGAEPFGALVSEWAQSSQGLSRQEMRPRPSRDQRPEIEPPAHPSPRAEDVAPRSRSSEARSRTEEAPRSRREAARRPDRDDLRTDERRSDDRPVTSETTRRTIARRGTTLPRTMPSGPPPQRLKHRRVIRIARVRPRKRSRRARKRSQQKQPARKRSIRPQQRPKPRKR